MPVPCLEPVLAEPAAAIHVNGKLPGGTEARQMHPVTRRDARMAELNSPWVPAGIDTGLGWERSFQQFSF
jgi:hypothetical protein